MTVLQNNGDNGAWPERHKQAIEQAMQEAVDDAIALHKRLGLPMVEWHDGQIVWTPAEQLQSPMTSNRQ